jgi:hypothetical protein
MDIGAIGIVILFITLMAWPDLAWQIRTPFLWTNRLQWFLIWPARHWMRDRHSDWPYLLFVLLSPVMVVYRVAAYVVLSPLRLLNAIYFNNILFWSVSLRDGIADLVQPLYNKQGAQYVLQWILFFPWRFIRFCIKYPGTILQGLAMTAFDLLWPTLTLFHGTGKREAVTIARTGEWHAGSGDFVGTGLYFGLQPEIAQHYARYRNDPLILIARVTLAPCRPVATLPPDLRKRIGRDGGSISRELKFPWVSLEHWRKDRQWYEFCLVQPSKYKAIKPWRVRPLCAVGKTASERLPGGAAVWPNTGEGWTWLVCTLLILLIPTFTLLPQGGLLRGTVIGKLFPAARAFHCPEAPPTRLQVGDTACVAQIGTDVLQIRSAPAVEADNVVGRIGQGARMSVLDGPACADRYVWWQVQVDDGPLGWVAEGRPENYFIEPCEGP